MWAHGTRCQRERRRWFPCQLWRWMYDDTYSSSAVVFAVVIWSWVVKLSSFSRRWTHLIGDFWVYVRRDRPSGTILPSVCCSVHEIVLCRNCQLSVRFAFMEFTCSNLTSIRNLLGWLESFLVWLNQNKKKRFMNSYSPRIVGWINSSPEKNPAGP